MEAVSGMGVESQLGRCGDGGGLCGGSSSPLSPLPDVVDVEDGQTFVVPRLRNRTKKGAVKIVV